MIATDLSQAWQEALPSAGMLNKLGDIVKSRVEPLFAHFRNDEFAAALAGVILGAAILVLLWYAVHVFRMRYRLWQWRTIVQDNDPAIFKAKLHAKIKEKPDSLEHAWIKFEQTLVEPDPDLDPASGQPAPDAEADPNLDHAPHQGPAPAPKQVFLSTVRPQTFFNASEVAHPSFRFYRILPGLFVGIGLLLTFLGLVSALHFAAAQIALSTTEQSQVALLGLLESAKFKFYASFAGLGASLLFVIALRIGDLVIDSGFDDFSRALEREIQIVTTQGLTRQLVFLGKRQLSELIKMNTDIAVAIGDQVSTAFEKNLLKHVDPKLADLGNRLETFAKNLSGMNAEAMQELVTTFTQQLQSTTQQQFEELTDMLGKVTVSLAAAERNIDGAGTELAGKLQGSTNAIGNAARTLTESTDGLESVLDGVTQRLEEIRKSLDESGESLNGLAGNLGTLTRDVTHASAALQQATDPLTRVAGILSRTSTEISESFANTTREINASLASLQSVASSLEATAEAVRDAWAQYSRHFNKVDADLDRMCTRLTSAADNLAQRIRDHINDMDRDLAGCVRHLHGFTAELKEILDEVNSTRSSGTSA